MKRITLKTKKIKILTLLLILPLAVYFWPSQLYGDTSYIMLMGNSMKGTIDNGTFVVIKPEQEYMAGDITEETWLMDDGSDWHGNGIWSIAGNGNNDWMYSNYEP